MIDQRTFSWTEFFNLIDPRSRGGARTAFIRRQGGCDAVSEVGAGAQAVDLEEFMNKLEATGAFSESIPAAQDRTDEGLLRALIEMGTKPSGGRDAAPAVHSAVPAGRRGAAHPAIRGAARGSRHDDNPRALTKAAADPADRDRADSSTFALYASSCILVEEGGGRRAEAAAATARAEFARRDHAAGGAP